MRQRGGALGLRGHNWVLSPILSSPGFWALYALWICPWDLGEPQMGIPTQPLLQYPNPWAGEGVGRKPSLVKDTIKERKKRKWKK